MIRKWLPLWLFIFLALQVFIFNEAWAEYRVYRLGIKYDDKQKKEIEVLTTLDHLQYATYYKLTPTQQTRLIEHWMCHGRTDGFKSYCSKPLVSAAIRLPAQSPIPSPSKSLSPQNPAPIVVQ